MSHHELVYKEKPHANIAKLIGLPFAEKDYEVQLEIVKQTKRRAKTRKEQFDKSHHVEKFDDVNGIVLVQNFQLFDALNKLTKKFMYPSH